MKIEERGDAEAPSSSDDLRTALVEIIANGAIREGQFQQALESRDVIGQAKGILMERENVTAEQAFEMLRTSSQHLNLKLRDVAAMVVSSVAAAAATPTE
jgi:AmiR/NasT family two-component response regulator